MYNWTRTFERRSSSTYKCETIFLAVFRQFCFRVRDRANCDLSFLVYKNLNQVEFDMGIQSESLL